MPIHSCNHVEQKYYITYSDLLARPQGPETHVRRKVSHSPPRTAYSTFAPVLQELLRYTCTGVPRRSMYPGSTETRLTANSTNHRANALVATLISTPIARCNAAYLPKQPPNRPRYIYNLVGSSKVSPPLEYARGARGSRNSVQCQCPQGRGPEIGRPRRRYAQQYIWRPYKPTTGLKSAQT